MLLSTPILIRCETEVQTTVEIKRIRPITEKRRHQCIVVEKLNFL